MTNVCKTKREIDHEAFAFERLLAEKDARLVASEARIAEQAAHIADLQTTLEHEIQQTKSYAAAASEERQLRLTAMATSSQTYHASLPSQPSPVLSNIVANVLAALLTVFALAIMNAAYHYQIKNGASPSLAAAWVSYFALGTTVFFWGHIVGSWVDKHGITVISKAHIIGYEVANVITKLGPVVFGFVGFSVIVHYLATPHLPYAVRVIYLVLCVLSFGMGILSIYPVLEEVSKLKSALDHYNAQLEGKQQKDQQAKN